MTAKEGRKDVIDDQKKKKRRRRNYVETRELLRKKENSFKTQINHDIHYEHLLNIVS